MNCYNGTDFVGHRFYLDGPWIMIPPGSSYSGLASNPQVITFDNPSSGTYKLYVIYSSPYGALNSYLPIANLTLSFLDETGNRFYSESFALSYNLEITGDRRKYDLIINTTTPDFDVTNAAYYGGFPFSMGIEEIRIPTSILRNINFNLFVSFLYFGPERSLGGYVLTRSNNLAVISYEHYEVSAINFMNYWNITFTYRCVTLDISNCTAVIFLTGEGGIGPILLHIDINIGNTPPTATFNPIHSRIKGNYNVSWTLNDIDGHDLTSSLYLKLSDSSYQLLVENNAETSAIVDTSAFPDAEGYQFVLNVSDSYNTTTIQSNAFEINNYSNDLPTGTIDVIPTVITGFYEFSWIRTDPDGDPVNSTLILVKPDLTNQTLVVNNSTTTSFDLDTELYPNAANYSIILKLSDGLEEVVYQSTLFEIYNEINLQPSCSITSSIPGTISGIYNLQFKYSDGNNDLLNVTVRLRKPNMSYDVLVSLFNVLPGNSSYQFDSRVYSNATGYCFSLTVTDGELGGGIQYSNFQIYNAPNTPPTGSFVSVPTIITDIACIQWSVNDVNGNWVRLNLILMKPDLTNETLEVFYYYGFPYLDYYEIYAEDYPDGEYYLVLELYDGELTSYVNSSAFQIQYTPEPDYRATAIFGSIPAIITGLFLVNWTITDINDDYFLIDFYIDGPSEDPIHLSQYYHSQTYIYSFNSSNYADGNNYRFILKIWDNDGVNTIYSANFSIVNNSPPTNSSTTSIPETETPNKIGISSGLSIISLITVLFLIRRYSKKRAES